MQLRPFRVACVLARDRTSSNTITISLINYVCFQQRILQELLIDSVNLLVMICIVIP